jgi:predicted nucleic acid-binding protein
MNAIDTNVLIYSLDSRDPAKQSRARLLLRGLRPAESTCIPWQVLGAIGIACCWLLAACLVADVDTLFTEDMGAPRKIDSLNLINPFL